MGLALLLGLISQADFRQYGERPGRNACAAVDPVVRIAQGTGIHRDEQS